MKKLECFIISCICIALIYFLFNGLLFIISEDLILSDKLICLSLCSLSIIVFTISLYNCLKDLFVVKNCKSYNNIKTYNTSYKNSKITNNDIAVKDMLVQKNNYNNLDNDYKLSSKVYNKSMDGTETLYKLLINNNALEIKDKTNFVFTSFIFHLYFYRIILLQKYSDNYICKTLTTCIDKMFSTITSNIKEKNTLVDKSNEIFNILDTFTNNFLTYSDRDSFQITNIAKYFIANIENCKFEEVYNSVAIFEITSYFSALLSEYNEFLLMIEN